MKLSIKEAAKIGFGFGLGWLAVQFLCDAVRFLLLVLFGR